MVLNNSFRMKSSEAAATVQKVELLCNRVTKLCATHPYLCSLAIQTLSDFVLSLESSVQQQREQDNPQNRSHVSCNVVCCFLFL